MIDNCKARLKLLQQELFAAQKLNLDARMSAQLQADASAGNGVDSSNVDCDSPSNGLAVSADDLITLYKHWYSARKFISSFDNQLYFGRCMVCSRLHCNVWTCTRVCVFIWVHAHVHV
jgi:hypothetical protein